MPNPNPTEITQAAREAAANMLHKAKYIDSDTRALIEAGGWDENPVVQSIAALGAENWQPIDHPDTPKDGTRVDLWARSPGLTAGPARIVDCWFAYGKWWRDDFEHGVDCREECHHVTHWRPVPRGPDMPLPSPPTTGDET